jgi:type IV secretory pathway TrbF-like protein
MRQSSPIAAARRNSELGLVIMAASISAVAYVLASLGKNSSMPATIIPFLIALLGMLVAAHIATRLLARGADSTLLPLAVMLHGIGYVMIARLSERRAAPADHVDVHRDRRVRAACWSCSARPTSPATSGRSSPSAPGC